MEHREVQFGVTAEYRFGVVVQYVVVKVVHGVSREEAYAECDRLNAELDAQPPCAWGVRPVYLYGEVDRYEVTTQGAMTLAEAEAECDRLNAEL